MHHPHSASHIPPKCFGDEISAALRENLTPHAPTGETPKLKPYTHEVLQEVDQVTTSHKKEHRDLKAGALWIVADLILIREFQRLDPKTQKEITSSAKTCATIASLCAYHAMAYHLPFETKRWCEILGIKAMRKGFDEVATNLSNKEINDNTPNQKLRVYTSKEQALLDSWAADAKAKERAFQTSYTELAQLAIYAAAQKKRAIASR